jgi:hypothetical protein
VRKETTPVEYSDRLMETREQQLENDRSQMEVIF